MTEQLDMFEYWEPQANPADMKPSEMVDEFHAASGQEPDNMLYFDLICEEFKEFSCGFDMNEEEELKEMADLVYVLYGYAKACGYDLDKALFKVHDNNMGRMFQDDGTILRRKDGKIMKNKNYPKVDLSDCIGGAA